MKKYQSFKIVEAGKITEISDLNPDTRMATVHVEGNSEGEIEHKLVSEDWLKKHTPEDESLIGGYLVRYEDGYTSWSPAEAFEGGYKVVESAMATGLGNLTNGFDWAINMVKRGKKVARKGWNNPTIKVFAQFPDKDSANTEPYLVMEKGENDTYKRFPLDLSAESIFADDWVIVD